MATRITAIGFLIALFLTGCTNAAMPLRSGGDVHTGSASATKVAELRFFQEDTTVLKMAMRGNQLHMTGMPHGYAAVDIATDPELSDASGNYKLFVAAENLDLFSPDPPFGGWIVNYFADGALGFSGRFAFMSGQAGMSVIDLNNIRSPQEVGRRPGLNSDGDQPQDLAYVYKAIVAHPTKPILYGFAAQDYIYKVNISSPNNPTASVLRPISASGGTVCCVTGATVFNGLIYVAMRGGMKVMRINADDSLSDVGESTTMQATNISSTASYLYVHHESLSGVSSSRSSGLYIFDKAGRQVKYLPIRPKSFAVHPNNTHIYANENNAMMSIYRINSGG